MNEFPLCHDVVACGIKGPPLSQCRTAQFNTFCYIFTTNKAVYEKREDLVLSSSNFNLMRRKYSTTQTQDRK